MAGVELVTTKQPHLIPGYGGYCPQYRFRCGETYGRLTHKLLLDRIAKRTDRLILSDTVAGSHEVTRPPKDDIDVVNSRCERTDSVYQHPMIPGYEGFVPKLNARNGQRYSIQATEGIAEFERLHLRNKEASEQLKVAQALQDKLKESRQNEGSLLEKSEFKLPVITVRPDCVGVMRNLPVDEQCEREKDRSRSPLFMENTNPEKNLVSGYSRDVPFGHAQFPESNAPIKDSVLTDFTTNYRMRQSTEWAPATITRPDPPLFIQPTEIYHKHIGLIPNYFGHVPGATFRYGKTFGADTRDAKRWLRGDFLN